MTNPVMLAHLAFTAILAAVSIVDSRRKTIPNALTAGGLLLALAAAACLPRLHATGSPRHALAAAAVGGLAGLAVGLLLRFAGNALLKPQMEKAGQNVSLGLGDVKLLAFLGAYLGIRAIFPILLVACLAGALVGAGRKLATGSPEGRTGLAGLRQCWRTGDSVLPFGPFLCLGAAAQLIPVFITAIK